MKKIPPSFKIVAIIILILLALLLAFLFFFSATKTPPIATTNGDTETLFPEPLQPHAIVEPPAVAFSADSTVVPYNGEVVLSWSSTNSESCSASDSWDGQRSTTGTLSTGPLTSAHTYDLTCVGKNGESTVQSITVNVLPPPTGTLSANPNPIPYGGNTMLTWSASDDADTCVAGGAWSGEKGIEGTKKESGLTGTRTYTLKCTGRGGTNTSSVTVSVIPLPNGDFNVSPTSVPYNEPATLTWSFSDASACQATGSWGGRKASIGTESTGPLTSSRTYTLKCTGRGGTTLKSATVRVLSLPRGTLVAEPTSIPRNSTATITWSASEDATSCTASGGWSGAKETEGSEVVGPLTSSQEFTLTCTGPGGTSLPRTAKVAVLGSSGGSGGSGSGDGTGSSKGSGELTAQPTEVPYNTSPTLTWSSPPGGTCTATGGWSGTREASGSETAKPVTRATTYSLRCTGKGGATSNSVKVNVILPPTTGTLRATPNPVPYGEQASVTWSSSKDATSCTASGGWSGAKETTGTELVGPFTSTQTLTLTCTGAGGESKPQSVIVKVLPKGDFAAENSQIVSGTSPVLKWNIENATSCTASGGWKGVKAASGTETVASITLPTTNQSYGLSCTGPGGTKSSSVTVWVIPLPTGVLTATPSVADYNGTVTLTWYPSSNTTSCTGDWGSSRDKSIKSGSRETVGPLTSKQTYTLMCDGPGGSVTKSVTVNIKPNVELYAIDTQNLVADKIVRNLYTVPLNTPLKLSWVYDQADTCTPTGWNNNTELTPTQLAAKKWDPITVTKNGVYSLVCSNAFGATKLTDKNRVTIKVKDPDLSLTTDATTVRYGGNANLTWSATDVISCTGSGGPAEPLRPDKWAGTKTILPNGTGSGTYDTGVLTAAPPTYTLSCSGPNRSLSKSVTIKVKPKVWFWVQTNETSDDSYIAYAWQSWNATSCVASGGWRNGWGANDTFTGTKALSSVAAQYQYSRSDNLPTTSLTLSCSGPGGTTSVTLFVDWFKHSDPVYEATKYE